MSEHCSAQIDKVPLNDMKTSAGGLYKDLSPADALETRLPVITQSDLEKAIAESGIMEHWEPEKWTRLKRLALAATSEGTVELMSMQQHPGKDVAVKIVPLNYMRSCPGEFDTQNPHAKKRPWTDIAMVKHLARLGCPFICELGGVFLGNEQVHIISSFANRGDLFLWCQNDKSNAGVPREIAMRPIVSQIFSGVQCLHNLGVAHRNLSTENVLLSDNGGNGLQVKIIDFGAASLSRTASQELRAKRSYQAPEMHGTAAYDTFLADNFSVGVIVYCMAVHYYPWEHTKPGKDRSFEFAHAHGLETFLSKKRLPCNKKPVAEVFSKSFVELLCGLLAFDPEMRYSLGEACFDKTLHQTAVSESSWLSGSSTI